jgi:hypothetical protein
MVENIFQPVKSLGPLKINGVSKPESFVGYKEGWFYPVFTTRSEAIQEDLDRGGQGIYRVLTFYNRSGEFYVSEIYNQTGDLKDPLIYTLYDGAGAENPFKRIQNRLSLLIEEQLPDFIQEDYSQFVLFLKAYYEFLEQNNQAQEVLQDIRRYADIDTTSEDLVKKFIENYANDLSQSRVANNRFLVKKIREIYNRKGTEPAYRMLFNILYKETIDFFYPYDIVLRPSTGRWTIRYALRVKQTNYRQNIFDFENTEILGKSSGAKAIVSKVIKLDLRGFEVYELILDSSTLKGQFSNDEEIFAEKTILLTGEDFTVSSLSALVYSVISKIDVIKGGLGYIQGHPITITDSAGILANAKVDSVNRFGAITNFDIIDSGLNYSNNTVISAGLPTETLQGRYLVSKGQVTLTFPKQHGLVRGDNIRVYYSGNIFSPIDNTNHTATIVSVPNIRAVRFRYPGF